MKRFAIAAAIAASGFLVVGCGDDIAPPTTAPVEQGTPMGTGVCGPDGYGGYVCDQSRYSDFVSDAQAEIACVESGRPAQECIG